MPKLVEPGTHARPRVMGRLLRILLGVLVFYAAVWPMVVSWKGLVRAREGWQTPAGTWWLAIILIIYLTPHMTDGGLGLRLGNRARAAVGLLFVLAAVANFVLYDSFWGPAFGGVLGVTSILVFGHLAVSFVVQGIAATPG